MALCYKTEEADFGKVISLFSIFLRPIRPAGFFTHGRQDTPTGWAPRSIRTQSHQHRKKPQLGFIRFQPALYLKSAGVPQPVRCFEDDHILVLFDKAQDVQRMMRDLEDQPLHSLIFGTTSDCLH